MPFVEVNKFEGMNVRIAPEKLPPFLWQSLVNCVISKREGWLQKRKGYTEITASGLTDLINMVELVDKDDVRRIIYLDGSALEYIAYSSGYGSATSFGANDERTGSSTIDSFFPVAANHVVRSGAGINASTDLPFWIGHLPARDRFSSGVSLTAGQYVQDMQPSGSLEELFRGGAAATNAGYGPGPIGIVAHASRVEDKGLTAGNYGVYASPVYDGFQKGFPVYIGAFVAGSSVNLASLEFYINVDSAETTNARRMTHIDLFVASTPSDQALTDRTPAFFTERIDLDADTDTIYEATGSVANGATSVTIADYADWLTFDAIGLYIYNETDDEYYRVTAETPSSDDMVFTVTPAPTNTASSKVLRFLGRWHSTTFLSNTVYQIRTTYDSYYREESTEMYAYLGIPSGDQGISDFRFKFCTMAGKRFFAVGFDDRDFGYYSVAGAPDVMPAKNFFPIDKDPQAIASYSDEAVLVFYKDSTQLIEVFGNENFRINDSFSRVGCVGQKAVANIDDRTLIWMDYSGPVLLSGSINTQIGEPLSTWWRETLTDAQKADCAVAFNQADDCVFFSFPTYTDSDHTAGIIFCFDLRAFRQQKLSAWSIIRTDRAVESWTVADDRHLLTSNGTTIIDWNNAAPGESVQASGRLQILRNPLFTNRINFNSVRVDYVDSGAAAVTIALFADGAGSATTSVSVSDSTIEQLIERIASEWELTFESTSSTDDFTLKSLVIEFTNMDG